jgi:galactonate dehydratase
VRVYGRFGGETPAEYADSAAATAADGYTAMKTGVAGPRSRVESPADVAATAERLAAAREAVGPEVDLAVDFHGRVSKASAPRLAAALDDSDPFFVEEPVLAEHNDVLRDVAAATTAPVATGERMFSRTDFRPLLADGAVDVIQPDLSHAGGITEVRKIASMAAAHDVAVAPHCPLGPLSFAAAVQVDAVAHNAIAQEQILDVHDPASSRGLSYLADPGVFDFADGFVTPPDAPGLGVTVDEDRVRRSDHDGDWQTPLLRHEDGSVAEW